MESSMQLSPNSKVRLILEDEESGNRISTSVEIFGDQAYSELEKALKESYKKLGVVTMSKPKEQEQDLKWQKPEESDNLQKSVRPDGDYMRDRGLNPDTHGKSESEKGN